MSEWDQFLTDYNHLFVTFPFYCYWKYLFPFAVAYLLVFHVCFVMFCWTYWKAIFTPPSTPSKKVSGVDGFDVKSNRVIVISDIYTRNTVKLSNTMAQHKKSNTTRLVQTGRVQEQQNKCLYPKSDRQRITALLFFCNSSTSPTVTKRDMRWRRGQMRRSRSLLT